MSIRKSLARKSKESGVSLFLGVTSLVMIVPMVGLTVDAGMLYTVKAHLQASVDGAALAAARALNLGQSTSAQTSNAQQNAVNWFYANFPNGTWSTSNTVMTQANVNVFDDLKNPNLRNVTVTASTSVPTIFMKWLNVNSTTISAVGNASRRDVVSMLVLDRSGSMLNSPGACAALVSAAKQFTGQFANGRDYIGLVSFGDNVYLHSPPTQNFQSVLGYSNASGSGTGELDSIVCSGGTNTAQALSLAYNELYKTNLPGALNLIMFETDGLPNTLTLNFWDSVNGVAGVANSPCKDVNGKTKGLGGFGNAASLPQWTAGHNMGSGNYLGANIPSGIIGGVGVQDPGSSNAWFTLYNAWTTTKANNFGESGNNAYVTSTSAAPGCAFTSSHNVSPPSDLAWAPLTDVYGNNLVTSYKSVTTSGGHVTLNYTNFRNAAFNAADDAANHIRDGSVPANGTKFPAYVYGIGLGGTSANPPDYVLMQRMANDPNGDRFNSPAKYLPCAQEPGCVTNNTQPQGLFLFAPDPSELNRAFLTLSSQILRLSK